jgi:hypothetical protein
MPYYVDSMDNIDFEHMNVRRANETRFKIALNISVFNLQSVPVLVDTVGPIQLSLDRVLFCAVFVTERGDENFAG